MTQHVRNIPFMNKNDHFIGAVVFDVDGESRLERHRTAFAAASVK
jgi:hypothetical protein